MDDADIKQRVLVKLQHRALKDGVDAASGRPSPPSAIDAGVMDLRTTCIILIDWQLLPLTAQIELLQNVVEDLEQTQFWRRTSAVKGKVRQDKLFKLANPQLRGNCLPMAASSHSGAPENWILPNSGAASESPALRRLLGGISGLRKPATS